MRFNNANEYGDAVLVVAGCTCRPKRVQQVLDASGAFTVEHYHQDHCAMVANQKLWHARLTGAQPPDTTTLKDRFERRVEADVGVSAIPKERAAQ